MVSLPTKGGWVVTDVVGALTAVEEGLGTRDYIPPANRES